MRTARRQIASSLEVANKQVTAPMRQAWINNLRDLLAELAGNSDHYFAAGFEERTDDEYRHLTHLRYRIELMLNPNEADHRKLETHIKAVVTALGQGRQYDQEFIENHKALIELTKTILKREWNVIKKPIAPAEPSRPSKSSDKSNN